MELPVRAHSIHERITLSFVRQDWFTRPQAGEASFAHAPAGMALSAEHSCGFVLDGVTLSNSALAFLGLSPHAAWELGARNLLRRAHSTRGYSFDHRPARLHTGRDTPGLQVRVTDAVATSWLAHPRTFSLLDAHFEQLMGTTVDFLSPDPAVLFAVPTDAPRAAWSGWLVHAYGAQEFLSIGCRDGFPRARPLAPASGRVPVPV